jgi:Integrase core domain
MTHVQFSKKHPCHLSSAKLVIRMGGLATRSRNRDAPRAAFLKIGLSKPPGLPVLRKNPIFAAVHCGIIKRCYRSPGPAHPTFAWTMQQLREAVGLESQYEYLLHDRDSIFAEHLDASIARLGIKVLKSPPRCPMANAICERVVGTIRRECLDWLIPLSESHLRSILKSWKSHYNTGRPHMGLGPGVPDLPPTTLAHLQPPSRHRRGESYAVGARPILGGLHHEYYLAPAAA